jgi:hypothetical protein
LPPYSVTDVKKAYRDKARRLHPDAGGDPQDFKALTFAYERALEYAEFRASRRQWLGNRIERYAVRETMIEQIEKLGGQYRLGPAQDYLDDFGGDFAEVIRTLVEIRLSGSGITDEALAWTEAIGDVGGEVRTLQVRDAKLSAQGLLRLSAFGSLRALDLRGTHINREGLAVLDRLPALEWVHLGRTGVGFWGRRRIRREYPRIEVVAKRSAEPPPDSHWDDSLNMLRRVGNL